MGAGHGTVRAAGGVLWRPAGEGIEICVVHRPYLRDWSLPKGKLDGGEHPLLAAVREVLEETGVRGHPQMALPAMEYDLPDGRHKSVDFWLMRAGDGPAVAVADPGEVDEVAWLAPRAAAQRVSYPTDRALLAHVAALPPVTAVTALVRHAHAGDRKKWTGNDALRPVDARGVTQAEVLGELLEPFRPARLYAATPLRCRQTLEPVAARTGLPIVSDPVFAEPGDAGEAAAKAKLAAVRLGELRDGPPAVICSQGKLMPPLLALLRGEDDPAPYKTPKGGGWILSWSGETLIGLAKL